MSASVRRTARPIAFGVALVASLSLMLFPFLLHGIDGTRLHTGLPVVMLGVTGMFVYGIGYIPDNKLIRVLFGPACASILIVAGGLLLLVG